jgi:hypothetical protein
MKRLWLRFLAIGILTLTIGTGGLSMFRELALVTGFEKSDTYTSFWVWIRICFVIAAFTTIVQEYRERRKAEKIIETLEQNLGDAPELTIRWLEHPTHTGFVVEIRNGKDAYNVELVPLGGPRFVAQCDPIPHLKAQEKRAWEIDARLRTGGGGYHLGDWLSDLETEGVGGMALVCETPFEVKFKDYSQTRTYTMKCIMTIQVYIREAPSIRIAGVTVERSGA